MKTYANHNSCGAGCVLDILDAMYEGREMRPFDTDTMQLLSKG